MSRFCGQASLTEVLLQKAFQHEVAQPTALAQKNLKHEAVWYYVETFYIHIYWHMQPPLHSILQQKYHLPRQFLGVSGSVYKGGAVSRSTICLLGWVSSLALIQKITENSMEHDEKTYADHWILNGKWWNAYETVENEWNMMRHIKRFQWTEKKSFFCFRSVSVQKYTNITISMFCFVWSKQMSLDETHDYFLPLAWNESVCFYHGKHIYCIWVCRMVPVSIDHKQPQ